MVAAIRTGLQIVLRVVNRIPTNPHPLRRVANIVQAPLAQSRFTLRVAPDGGRGISLQAGSGRRDGFSNEKTGLGIRFARRL